MARFDFQAIGTTWRIDIFEELDVAGEAELLSRIKARIDAFDLAYSRFRPDSLVTKMSKEAGTYELPLDADAMISLYHDLYIKTNGLVTPMIGDLISDAGYDARYSLRKKGELKTPPAWDEAIEYRPSKSGRHNSGPARPPIMVVRQPVLLDFGAAGKGYLIDLVGGVLEANGIFHYGINAGGDILYKNKKPDTDQKADVNKTSIRVGLEDPDNAEKVIGVCVLEGGSICGSAGNRRKWGTFTHIINPKTLISPSDIIAVWVTSATALIADGLATCLFFVPASALTDAYDFEYVILRKDRSVEKSAHFPGELFILQVA